MGGIGNVRGYMYRTSGMDVSESWVGTWEQQKNYEFLAPGGVPLMSCAPTTQYGVVVMDPNASPEARKLSVGYGSQLFDFASGVPNYDACVCGGITGNPDSTWVQQALPVLQANGKPLFRGIAKVTSTISCAAGGFGRIVLHDTATGSAVDVGSTIPRRLNDGAFIDTMTGAVFGQHLDIHYTEDAGLTWVGAATDPSWIHNGGHQGQGIAFDSLGAHGIAVGDQLGPPFDDPFNGKGFLARTIGSLSTPYTDWVMLDPAITVSPTETAAPMDLRDVTFAPVDSSVFE